MSLLGRLRLQTTFIRPTYRVPLAKPLAVRFATRDLSSVPRTDDTSWHENGDETSGSTIHGTPKKKAVLGGSLSMNKDKMPDKAKGDALRQNPAKGDLGPEGLEDHAKRDARNVGGQDDTRKQT